MRAPKISLWTFFINIKKSMAASVMWYMYCGENCTLLVMQDLSAKVSLPFDHDDDDNDDCDNCFLIASPSR